MNSRPSDLASLDEHWSKTSSASNTRAAGPAADPYSDMPDGAYDAVIEDVRLTETVSTQRPVVIWTLRIQGPHAVNRVVRRNRVITENTLPFLKEDLEKCGLVLSRLSELGSRLQEISGRPVRIEKRTKGEQSQFWFRWKGPKAGAAPPELDDIPF